MFVFLSATETTSSETVTVSANNTVVCAPASKSYFCYNDTDCTHGVSKPPICASVALPELSPLLGVCNSTCKGLNTGARDARGVVCCGGMCRCVADVPSLLLAVGRVAAAFCSLHRVCQQHAVPWNHRQRRRKV